jgi:hypothetical protein
LEIADLRMLCMTIKLMNGIRLDQVMKRFGQWVHAIANGRSRRSLFLGVGTIFGYIGGFNVYILGSENVTTIFLQKTFKFQISL